MPSKNKPLTDAELDVYEAGRDLAADILQSIAEMKAGQVKPVDTSAIEARMKTGLSQSQFARLLGVSVRTLQGWEQGRKHPSGAAKTLLVSWSNLFEQPDRWNNPPSQGHRTCHKPVATSPPSSNSKSPKKSFSNNAASPSSVTN